MKKFIQQYFMAIVAVMMIVGFSAFKMVEENKESKTLTKNDTNSSVLLVQWSFIGTSNSQVTSPSSYDKVLGSPPVCGGSQTVCIIEAPDDGNGKPDLSQHIDLEDPLSPTYMDLINEAMDQTPKATNTVVLSLRN